MVNIDFFTTNCYIFKANINNSVWLNFDTICIHNRNIQSYS